jgi:uncharacterized protein involved in cysteine biosynthesis
MAGSANGEKGGAFSRFFRGAGFAFKGIGFAFSHGRLWPFTLAPALLVGVAVWLGAWEAYRLASSFIEGRTAGHGAILGVLYFLIALVLAVAVGYVVLLIVVQVATAPFAGILSERTEKLARGQAPAPQGLYANLKESVRSLFHTVATGLVYAVCALTVVALQLLLSPLAPFFALLGVVVSGTWIAYDAFDQPLSRRGAGLGEKWRYLGAHTAEALGFGCTVALLLLVPGFIFFIPATSVVGGTLLYLRLGGDAV